MTDKKPKSPKVALKGNKGGLTTKERTTSSWSSASARTARSKRQSTSNIAAGRSSIRHKDKSGYIDGSSKR